MRAYEFIDWINSMPFKVEIERWVRLKQYYISMYHFYLLKLYDLGYISDPTDVDEKELRTCIADLEIHNCEDECGKVLLTSQYALYALKLAKDEEQKEFLNLLYETLRYREYFIELDKLYENASNGTINFTLTIKGCSRITTMDDVKFNRGVFSILVKDGYTVKEINIRKEMFDLAMKELGISRSDYCDNMFIEGLSLEDHIYFAEIILNGKVKLTGVYADKLIDWLSKHKWCNTKILSVNSKGLYSYIYGTKSNEVLRIIERNIDEHLSKEDLVMAYEDRLYIEKPIENYTIPFGLVAVYSDEFTDDIMLNYYNATNGFNGECYDYSYIHKNGLDCVGVPFKINVGTIECYVFDVSQVSWKVRPDSWFKTVGASFEFEDDFYRKSFLYKGSTEYEVFNAWIYANRGIIYKVKSPKNGYKGIVKAIDVVQKEINRIMSEEE